MILIDPWVWWVESDTCRTIATLPRGHTKIMRSLALSLSNNPLFSTRCFLLTTIVYFFCKYWTQYVSYFIYCIRFLLMCSSFFFFSLLFGFCIFFSALDEVVYFCKLQSNRYVSMSALNFHGLLIFVSFLISIYLVICVEIVYDGYGMIEFLDFKSLWS